MASAEGRRVRAVLRFVVLPVLSRAGLCSAMLAAVGFAWLVAALSSPSSSVTPTAVSVRTVASVSVMPASASGVGHALTVGAAPGGGSKPSTPKSSASKPSGGSSGGGKAKPAASKPAASKPAASKPAASKPAASKPAATKPAATKPAATKPAATKPAATKPAATKPAATKPAATKPAATKPAATKPAATKPAGAIQGAKVGSSLAATQPVATHAEGKTPQANGQHPATGQPATAATRSDTGQTTTANNGHPATNTPVVNGQPGKSVKGTQPADTSTATTGPVKSPDTPGNQGAVTGHPAVDQRAPVSGAPVVNGQSAPKRPTVGTPQGSPPPPPVIGGKSIAPNSVSDTSAPGLRLDPGVGPAFALAGVGRQNSDGSYSLAGPGSSPAPLVPGLPAPDHTPPAVPAPSTPGPTGQTRTTTSGSGSPAPTTNPFLAMDNALTMPGADPNKLRALDDAVQGAPQPVPSPNTGPDPPTPGHPTPPTGQTRTTTSSSGSPAPTTNPFLAMDNALTMPGADPNKLKALDDAVQGAPQPVPSPNTGPDPPTPGHPTPPLSHTDPYLANQVHNPSTAANQSQGQPAAGLVAAPTAGTLARVSTAQRVEAGLEGLGETGAGLGEGLGGAGAELLGLPADETVVGIPAGVGLALGGAALFSSAGDQFVNGWHDLGRAFSSTAPAAPATPKPSAAPTLPSPQVTPGPGTGPAPTRSPQTAPNSPLIPNYDPLHPPNPFDPNNPFNPNATPTHNQSPNTQGTGTPHTDGPPTVGGGEKTRGNRYQDGQLQKWDEQQKTWRPIAQVGGGAPTSGSGGPTGPAVPGPRQPHIGDLDRIFAGQPDEARRYQRLSRLPSDQLSSSELKFVQETRAQITIGPNEAMTKVMKLEDVQKQIKGPFTPNKVRGFVARARDTDQLRTPSQMRDGLALDDSATIAAGGTPWAPIPADGSYAYQMTWNATDGTGFSVPDGPPKAPFTGTGTTAGGIPEWYADGAPIEGPAQIWKIDRLGHRQLYSAYDPSAGSWSDPP